MTYVYNEESRNNWINLQTGASEMILKPVELTVKSVACNSHSSSVFNVNSRCCNVGPNVYQRSKRIYVNDHNLLNAGLYL